MAIKKKAHEKSGGLKQKARNLAARVSSAAKKTAVIASAVAAAADSLSGKKKYGKAGKTKSS